MWLDNLKELKAEKGLSVKQIAERSKTPERTVSRIFSGETDNPYVDTLRRIVEVMDASLEDIFADTKVVVGRSNLATLQADNERLTAEIEKLTGELALISAEYAVQKDKVIVLTNENELLNLKLNHKDEIIALHNYYMKVKSND
jgi:transcriptional regulator with XRE-family HTH domain